MEQEFDVSEFILPDGFSIQQIAAEPLLNSPMAMSFDEKGQIWVVELPGYMRDIDGSEEDKKDGRIVLLKDKNADGVMDQRHVVLDGLQAPRTLLHVYGGLLYSDGPALWWVRLNGDEPGKKVLVDSTYIRGGNIEHQPNGLLYNLDNWIYSANSSVRYRYKDGNWLREATTFRGQWGLSMDTRGRLYYNNNSLPLATDFARPNQLIGNPYQKVRYGINREIPVGRSLLPYQATSVNRGYSPGVLDSLGRVTAYTSACSPLIYLGDQLGEEFREDAFVCAPEANLVKRYKLSYSSGKAVAKDPSKNKEFLISKKESFRPVNLYNAPDGSLYVLDLRKGIIQHRAYMTSYLREEILKKGLDSINGKGRIYRVARNEFPFPSIRNYSRLGIEEWVQLLESELFYERMLAQKYMVSAQLTEAIPFLKQLALKGEKPFVVTHALWTLEGLGGLDREVWSEWLGRNEFLYSIENLIALTPEFSLSEKEILDLYRRRISDSKTPGVQQQIILQLGSMESDSAKKMLFDLMDVYGNDPLMCETFISGITGKEEEWQQRVLGLPNADTLKTFLRLTIQNKKSGKVQAPQLPKGLVRDNRTKGLQVYQSHCSACHGMDGKGKENLAPPLTESEYVGGSKDQLILLLLNGLKGPIKVNGKQYNMNLVMPGIKDNPSLSDKDIADLCIFLRNSFSFSDAYVSEEQVSKWREHSKDRKEPYTEDELRKYP